MTSRSRRVGESKVSRTYRVAGLVMGGLWALEHGHSLAEHAIRFGVLLFVVVPILTWVMKRRALARGLPGLPISMVRLVIAKAVLLSVALAATWILQRHGAVRADYIVAAGLAVTIALVGPRINHLFMTNHSPTADPALPATQR